jgi:hypothetical protein
MKKIIIILILIFCFYYCKKQEDFCWTCEYVKYTELDTSTPTIKNDTFEICYKTEEWIKKYEDTYTYSICDDSSVLKCYKRDSI